MLSANINPGIPVNPAAVENHNNNAQLFNQIQDYSERVQLLKDRLGHVENWSPFMQNAGLLNPADNGEFGLEFVPEGYGIDICIWNLFDALNRLDPQAIDSDQRIDHVHQELKSLQEAVDHARETDDNENMDLLYTRFENMRNELTEALGEVLAPVQQALLENQY